jgi:ankyrin repeat protein
MSDEYETNMTSWETTISELYKLYTACKKRESQEVRKLIQQLKKRNVKFKLTVGNGTTTLHLMCFHGNFGMVKLLVEMYGNVDAKDENQRTPLHLACMQGHLEIAQYLYFELGCNLQCKDKDGWTLIELAFFHNHTDIMKYLSEYRQLPKDLLRY